MQRTTNYNFKKPDYTDFADIQDLNDNFDAIDEELAAPTGDLANARIKSSTASTASYPVPAANDTMKVMLGKIIKFCADIVKTFTGATASAAGKKGLVPAPAANQHTRFLRADGTWREPVNGAGTTTAGDVLDARMGKTLNDRINTLNDSFTLSIIRRRVITLTKTITANSYESVTVTASDLSLGSDEVIKLCSVHLQYYGSAASFQIGSEVSYRVSDDNRSVLIGVYNTTQTQRTYNVQCEVIVNRMS